MITNHLTYDLYQFDGQFWQRIYRNLDRPTMIHNLQIELSEPTQKGKWKVIEIRTERKEIEVPLDSLGVGV